jgi:two-component system sensor histidine kinase CpxA
MKSTILKIFIAYWFVVVGVNIVSDLIAPEQMHRPPVVRDALRSAMELYGQQQVDSYELHGCGGETNSSLPSGDVLYLADANGQSLCTGTGLSGLDSLATMVRGSKKMLARRFNTFQVVGMSMKSRSGREYILFLKSHYVTQTSFLSWILPGPTSIVSSCVITLVFAVLLTLPLRRLRKATREMAMGKLDVRVPLRYHMVRYGRALIDDDLDRLTRDFNYMAERLQSLVAAQHLLLRDVSHELRSPLARLNVALELARREAPSRMQSHLERLEREAQRLNDLIVDLLSLSYMETTQEIRSANAVSLNDLVRDVLANVQYEANQRGCHIAAIMRENGVVHGDARLLESAFENILRNALRYTPENGVIEVDLAETYNGEQRRIELRVCDRGPGVPPEHLDAILRPFYRVDSSRESKTGGFGIGLAIADRAVRLHGGTIVAINRPDGGLVVQMSFPTA